MTTSFAAKISAASGNTMVFGSDNGLYAPPGAAITNDVGWTIDNYFGASGATWWYSLPMNGQSPVAGASIGNNVAQVWPLVVAKASRLTDAQIWLSAAGAAGSTFNVSLYNSAGANRQPVTKITDALRFPTTATGIARASTIDTTTVLAAQTLYWAVSWFYTTSTFPTVYCRNLYGGWMRAATSAVQASYFGGGLASMESSITTWSSMTTAPATMPGGYTPLGTGGSNMSSVNYQVPNILWGLTNV